MVQNNEINQQGDQNDKAAERAGEHTQKLSQEVQKSGSVGGKDECKDACEKAVGGAMTDRDKWQETEKGLSPEQRAQKDKEAIEQYKKMDAKDIQAMIENNNKVIAAITSLKTSLEAAIPYVLQQQAHQERLQLEARMNGK
ncbi:MAG: hypothetical protein K2X77_34180 [Candidatus Obscuribacterales bacterium]|nr:hypothetical protein [Candidatus Obscuribacterales bacterium]